jgi:molybdopterin-guanine dinucleotide biosynthesis protein A
VSPALVAVLAGGRGRRLGGAKAAVPLGGRPLVAHPLAAAAAAGLEAVVVAKPGAGLPELGVPVWEEPAAPVHPLAGVVFALERAGGPIVAVACDMPWVAPGLLRLLAGATQNLLVPRVAGRLEPFPARYGPAVLAPLRDALAREAGMRATLDALGPAELDAAALGAFGDPARLVASVNTPEELAAAERELGSRSMPTAEEWLATFAAALGRPAPDDDEIRAVLELASIAAHASERRAAPVACWLAAVAGVPPEEARARAEALPDTG